MVQAEGKASIPDDKSFCAVPDERSFCAAFNACGTPKEVLPLVGDLPVGDLARRLYSSAEASADLLGACLGDHAPYFRKLANEYPKLWTEVAGMGLVDALRAYLWRLRLPGESAQIERIVTGFASAYYELNRLPAGPRASDAHGVSIYDFGHYVRQPDAAQPCCAHCGCLGSADMAIHRCRGCGKIEFCRRCCRLASRYGHSAVGSIGYGRACVAALGLRPGDAITYDNKFGKGDGTQAKVSNEDCHWTPSGCPARSGDALMVLCYSIIMLTTNLHNPKVRDKMTRREFVYQNRDINDGENFPGDFLATIYEEILARELSVKSAGAAA